MAFHPKLDYEFAYGDLEYGDCHRYPNRRPDMRIHRNNAVNIKSPLVRLKRSLALR
jgi:hypothetical protein